MPPLGGGMEIIMIELGINNIAKYYGVNKIFENINLEVKTGERIGLIGQNGCGKTTLFKMIMGIEEINEGEINIRKDAKVAYLNQIPTFKENTTVIEVIQMAFEKIFKIKGQMDQLEKTFTDLEGNELDKVLQQYGELTNKFEVEGGYHLETKIDKITDGLEINDALKNMYFDALSGGEKTRAILAKILLEEPDILLLDEPTNHLDLETIKWLEEFLKGYQGSVVVISHDRYFLDSVVSKIIELEQSQVNTYHGDYTYYLEEFEKGRVTEQTSCMTQGKIDICKENKYNGKERIGGKGINVKKLEILEQRIEDLESKIKKLEDKIIRYNNDYDKLNEIYKEKEKLDQHLLASYTEWETMLETKQSQ
ncbi:MAG: ABC-F family ATP-binding cassette domain-containing protein [Anaerocolumna sp.]